MKIEIKSWLNNSILFEGDFTCLSKAVEAAVLDGASLDRASLDNGEKIIRCERPILMISPIGSSSRTLTAYLTDNGIRLRTGCFFGSVKEFETAPEKKGGDNHAQDYQSAIKMIESHFQIWK